MLISEETAKEYVTPSMMNTLCEEWRVRSGDPVRFPIMTPMGGSFFADQLETDVASFEYIVVEGLRLRISSADGTVEDFLWPVCETQPYVQRRLNHFTSFPSPFARFLCDEFHRIFRGGITTLEQAGEARRWLERQGVVCQEDSIVGVQRVLAHKLDQLLLTMHERFGSVETSAPMPLGEIANEVRIPDLYREIVEERDRLFDEISSLAQVQRGDMPYETSGRGIVALQRHNANEARGDHIRVPYLGELGTRIKQKPDFRGITDRRWLDIGAKLHAGVMRRAAAWVDSDGWNKTVMGEDGPVPWVWNIPESEILDPEDIKFLDSHGLKGDVKFSFWGRTVTPMYRILEADHFSLGNNTNLNARKDSYLPTFDAVDKGLAEGLTMGEIDLSWGKLYPDRKYKARSIGGSIGHGFAHITLSEYETGISETLAVWPAENEDADDEEAASAMRDLENYVRGQIGGRVNEAVMDALITGLGVIEEDYDVQSE